MREVTVVCADLAYAGTLVDRAKSFLHLTIKTVSRPRVPEYSEAMLKLAAITLMTRPLTRGSVHPTSAAPRRASRRSILSCRVCTVNGGSSKRSNT
ncbi:hypothetical protein [Streptomyces sp. NPDC056464]|uniref:hypothetical protein n=1 Tax=Streptomyces sp. NPDC056464 TaxID=3345828 RepID=UPI00367D7B12